MKVTSKQSSRYLFLVGKVRVLEKELFDFARFNRLIENKNIEDFLNDLSDSRYHNFIIKGEFETGLKSYIYSHYDYFRKNMPDSTVLDIFMIKNDILNYINFFKGLEKDEFYEPGVFKGEWWKGGRLPLFFRKVEERLKKLLRSKEISQAQERMIEKVCVDIINEDYIKSIQSSMVLDYWKCMIDIKNLFKNIVHPQGQYYLAGGNIKESFWREVNVNEDIPPKLEAQSYMKKILEEKNRINRELILRRWLGGLVKEMRKITFGPESVVSYFLSIIEEVMNLRLIYTGINLKYSTAEIKGKLNLSYV